MKTLAVLFLVSVVIPIETLFSVDSTSDSQIWNECENLNAFKKRK